MATPLLEPDPTKVDQPLTTDSAPAITPAPSPNSIFGSSAAPAPSAAALFTPQPYDESKSVENRTARIAGSGSPLMQLAETRGIQAAAARGLTNSSIGIESAANAVLDKAVPIATADAGLATQTANVNTQVQGSMTMQQAAIAQQMRELDTQKEQFAQSLGMTAKDLDLRRDTLTQQQQQFVQQLDLQKSQLTQQESQFGRSLSANQQNFQAELAQRQVLANMDASTRLQLGQLDAQSRSAVQGSVNLSNAWNQMMTNIANIQNNANLEAGAKSTLIQNNMEAFKSFSSFWQKLQGGAVDVSDLLNFNTAGAPNTPAAPAAPGTPGGGFADPEWVGG